MDLHHTPAWTHLVTRMPSRRDVVRGLAGTGLGMAARRPPDTVAAKKKRKRKDKNKKTKMKRNAFGCVDVGGKCQGNSANCCSGICEGQKPKRGKKDTSACVAHDNAGVCFPDSNSCAFGEVVRCTRENLNCLCLLTTGNAGFCGDFSSPDGPETLCRDCDKDVDCQEEFGPGAACVLFAGACSGICPATGRTACVRPCPAEAP